MSSRPFRLAARRASKRGIVLLCVPLLRQIVRAPHRLGASRSSTKSNRHVSSLPLSKRLPRAVPAVAEEQKAVAVVAVVVAATATAMVYFHPPTASIATRQRRSRLSCLLGLA